MDIRNELITYAVCPSRCLHQGGMRYLVANGGEDAFDYILHTDGRIIIHRTGHRDEIEDEIIGKEGGCHDETAFLKLLVPIPEIIHTHHEDDGVIHGIGYLEKLAQDGLCELLRKDERGLEAKDHLVPMGYDRIEIGEQYIDIGGILIPPRQEQHLYQNPKELRGFAGHEAIDRPQAQGDGGDAHAAPDHFIGVGNLRETEQYN